MCESVYSDSTLKLVLIFACVVLHSFGLGLFFSHPFTEQLYDFNGEQVDFSQMSGRATFLLRVVGSCCLGIIADKIGFVKTMRLICVISITASMLLVFHDTLNVFEAGMILCSVRGLHSFFRVASFILPITYILRHYEKMIPCEYSSFAWTLGILGIMLADLCVSILPNFQPINWSLVYTTSSTLSLIIYCSIRALPESNTKQAVEPISKPAFLLTFLLTGICGVGFSYQGTSNKFSFSVNC